MATDVKFGLKSHPLSREENGVVFTVEATAGGGELIVSKGGFRWKPKGKQKQHFSNWSDFDKYMQTKPKR